MENKARQKRRHWLHTLKSGDDVRLVAPSGHTLGVGTIVEVEPEVDQLLVQYPGCHAKCLFSRSIGIALGKNTTDQIEPPMEVVEGAYSF